ncbi:MAG: NAD-glutamate dehydrogenase, partial [Alphaproteobacteria bacterium]
MRHFLLTDEPMLITKANVKATVHRRVHMDYIGIKQFSKGGKVVGEHSFVGLFTSTAYSRQARNIPLLRQKVAYVLDKARFDPAGHAGKALAHILENFPRDELFQIDRELLYETAMGILYLQERPRTKVFVRKDRFERFVSVLAYIPREHYNGEIRVKVGRVLEEAFNGEVSTFYLQLSEDTLARIHYIIRTRPGNVPRLDQDKLDARVADVVKGWNDRLLEGLTAAHGEDTGRIIYFGYQNAFSAAYKEHFTADHAVTDIEKLRTLANNDDRAFNLYERANDDPANVRLKIYRKESIIPLSDCLPMLEHLGLRVVEEYPYNLTGGPTGWIHDFLLRDTRGRPVDPAAVRDRVEAALAAVSSGRVDDDGFNALIIRAGLDVW